MNLIQSFHYANFLERLSVTALTTLSRGFVTTTKEIHYKNKANPNVEDEVITLPKLIDVDYHPNDVINFIMDILAEKEALANAIEKAKASAEIDIDTAKATNEQKRIFINKLNELANIKPSEKQKEGYGYKFNNIDGNQIRYCYNINEVTTIDFDRNTVKKLAKKLSKECDDLSNRIDLVQINTQVDFEPKFDINDKFEDIILN